MNENEHIELWLLKYTWANLIENKYTCRLIWQGSDNPNNCEIVADDPSGGMTDEADTKIMNQKGWDNFNVLFGIWEARSYSQLQIRKWFLKHLCIQTLKLVGSEQIMVYAYQIWFNINK